jgi:hypothetical protein
MTSSRGKLFERLLDTDVKAELLTLFHNNTKLSDTSEDLAKRIGRTPIEVQHELEDLISLGVMKKTEVYSFRSDRDRAIQEVISKQLALGDTFKLERSLIDLTQGIQYAPTTIDILDSLLPNGAPQVSTNLILHDPGAGVENLLANFVSRHLTSGKATIHFCADPIQIQRSVVLNAVMSG